MGRGKALRVALAAGLVLLAGTSAFAAKAWYLPDAQVLPGLAVDGERVEDGATAPMLRASLTERAEALRGRTVALVIPGKGTVLEATLGELGLRVDVERTVAAALRAGKDGDWLTRAEAARAARDGQLDVPLATYVDRDVAMKKLLALKAREDVPPVSARLDLEKHGTIPERNGRYVDADDTIAALERVAREPRESTVTVPVRSFPARITSAFLESLEIGTVLAEYETHFSRGGAQSRRGNNIDNAARKLDGLVISPGEWVSFNDVVGERSEANGFEKSWEIFKGEMVEGIGGGTCQVSSTLYASAFFGGLDVLERLPHSRPSAYIPMGLDSTVVYPAVDLKVRNPHPFPVVVHAKTTGNKLRVELLGKAKPSRVAFEREVLKTLPYKRKIEEDAKLSGHRVVVKQHGIQGFKIKRSRIFTYPDGQQRREQETDTYPATTEIYQVPVGFDVALLPPLPGGDEGEGTDVSGASPAAPASGEELAAVSAESASSDIVFVDAPGAHAPTAAQRDPQRKFSVRR